MRPLLWWVQDHLGLAAAGLLGVVVIIIIVIAASGGSSDAPPQSSKVAASGSAQAGQASSDEVTPPPAAQPTRRHRAHASPGHHRREARRQKAEPTHAAGSETSAMKSKSHTADGNGVRQPQTEQPSEAAPHSLGQATAEKVAAEHPGTKCPKSYSTEQCEEAVLAAVNPAPSIPVTRPSDCTKAMSEAQCEALFAAEAAARAAGTGSISVQECMEHPEQEKCAAVVEEMKAQYEAAHPGG
jgi:hypothetical protein